MPNLELSCPFLSIYGTRPLGAWVYNIFSSMFETTTSPLLGSTILFHCLYKLPIFTPIALAPSGPSIFLRIIILGKVGLLLFVMDLKEMSSSSTPLVMILNIKFIVLLSLE
jgi:hypothetical protein